MKYQELRTLFSEKHYFCTDRIYRYDPHFDRKRLVEWSQKGYIIWLKRERYLFADAPRHRDLLFHLANHFYTPSYISLHSALSRYGLIPETTITVTSISTKKTTQFDTSIGSFAYKSCKPVCLTGYTMIDSDYGAYALATREKTCADLLYFSLYRTEEDFASLRLNIESLKTDFDTSLFRSYIALFEQKNLSAVAELFIHYLTHA